MRQIQSLGHLSRRAALSRIGFAPVAAIATSFGAPAPYRPTFEFPFGQLLSVSPDGQRLAIYTIRDSTASFRLGGKGWTPNHPKDRGDVGLRIVQVGTWKEQRTRNSLPGELEPNASFFSDSCSLFLERFGDGQVCRQILRLVDDQWHGSAAVCKSTKPALITMEAIANGKLIGNELNGGGTQGALVIFQSEDWKAVKRVRRTELQGPGANLARHVGPHVSQNRAFVLESVGTEVVLRRTEDLETCWRQTIGPGWSIVRLGIAADGGFIAVLLGQAPYGTDVRPSALLVLSGKDGSKIAQFPVTGIAGVGISLDGKVAAVAERLQLDDKLEDTQMNVHVYDVHTGRRTASLEHDRLRVKRGRGADASFSYNHAVTFSLDGRYLISSGVHTKVWRLSTPSGA